MECLLDPSIINTGSHTQSSMRDPSKIHRLCCVPICSSCLSSSILGTKRDLGTVGRTRYERNEGKVELFAHVKMLCTTQPCVPFGIAKLHVCNTAGLGFMLDRFLFAIETKNEGTTVLCLAYSRR